MVVKARDIARVMEQIAPPQLAEDWDNSGWQVGDPGSEIKKVMFALDVTGEVVSEARKAEAQLIISHHPLLLKGLKSIRRDSQIGNIIYGLIEAGISVYSAHTNLDSAVDGVNDILSRVLDLKDVEVLNPVSTTGFYKLVVFVPEQFAEQVRNALGNAGAGWVGKYSHCTFNTKGIGTFLPKEGANPFIGVQGEIERVEEARIETIIRKENKAAVLNAMLKAHPYEEVAYDVYPLENKSIEIQGLGRIGMLPDAITLKTLAQKVKNYLNVGTLRVGGDSSELIEKIAVCGGSGGDLWPLARARGARVLITGDVRYHAARDMLEAGMNFIDAGHFATERLVLPALKERLAKEIEKAGLDLKIILAKSEIEPWENI